MPYIIVIQPVAFFDFDARKSQFIFTLLCNSLNLVINGAELFGAIAQKNKVENFALLRRV